MKIKKRKMMLAVVIFIVIATTAAFIVRYSINKKAVDVKDIVRIEIDESGGSSGYTALRQHHEIDFESNTAVTHIENPNADPKQSDSKTTFTEKDKEYFIKYANYYGFFNWKESYTCDYYDMSGTNICITFKNGAQKNINCYGKFPLTYDKMKKVFEKAFGLGMFIY